MLYHLAHLVSQCYQMPKQYQAEVWAAKIKVNPTQVHNHQPHPVDCVSLCEAAVARKYIIIPGVQEFSNFSPRLQWYVDGPVAVLVGKVGGAAEPGFGFWLSFLFYSSTVLGGIYKLWNKSMFLNYIINNWSHCLMTFRIHPCRRPRRWRWKNSGKLWSGTPLSLL